MPLPFLYFAVLAIAVTPGGARTAVARPVGALDETQPAVRAEISEAELQTLPPKARAFVEESERLRRGSISRLEHELRGLRSGNLTARDREVSIRRVETNLAALRSNEEPLARTLWYPLEQGAIGRLPGLGGHVEQVLGPREMLVTGSFRVDVIEIRHYLPRRETVWRPETFLVRGLPTLKSSVGRDLELADIFEVTGKYTYQSESGSSQTVLVLEPFDLRLVERFWPHMKIAKTNAEKPAPSPPHSAVGSAPPTATETPR